MRGGAHWSGTSTIRCIIYNFKLINEHIHLRNIFYLKKRGYLNFTIRLNTNVHIFYYGWYGTPAVDGEWVHWNHRYLGKMIFYNFILFKISTFNAKYFFCGEDFRNGLNPLLDLFNLAYFSLLLVLYFTSILIQKHALICLKRNQYNIFSRAI